MYTVALPDHLQDRLDERAVATGCEAADLIRMAVVQFVGQDQPGIARRMPDPPLAATEAPAPFDIPRGEATFLTPDVIIDGPARIPDLGKFDP